MVTASKKQKIGNLKITEIIAYEKICLIKQTRGKLQVQICLEVLLSIASFFLANTTHPPSNQSKNEARLGALENR